jgi:hypothetical protein
LDQDSHHTLAGLIGQILWVCFYDGYAVSQLLTAGFLDASYDPSSDEDWDADMWDVEHEDVDEGMAVDEFNPRCHEDVELARMDQFFHACTDLGDDPMDSDDEGSGSHYPLPDNYDHSFAYHALAPKTLQNAPIF